MQNATGPGSIENYPSAIEPSSAGGPSFADASFAGLLATLATPQRRDSSWNDDELAADVATISYERALRNHARSSPIASGGGSAPAKSEGESSKARLPATDGYGVSPALPKSLKTASITIRLSDSECAQVRRRAAEAGLTVSAYLRSCMLEVESLRAQVKQTLADLKNSPPPSDSRFVPEPVGRSQNALGRLRAWLRLIGRKPAPPIGLHPAGPLAHVR